MTKHTTRPLQTPKNTIELLDARARDELTDVFEYRLFYYYTKQQKPISQSLREVAEGCRMSVGKASQCRRALIEKGFISDDVRKSPVRKITSDSRRGYVYVLATPIGAYKIGRTAFPDNRLRTFAARLPFAVEYFCLISTDDMITLENELHRFFAHKRTNGEWFALTETDLAYLKELANERRN